MKTYGGFIKDGVRTVVVVDDNGRKILPARDDLIDFKQREFGWAGAVGMDRLALALCADVLNDDKRTLAIFEYFKTDTVATFDRDKWTTNETKIRATIATLEHARDWLANERKKNVRDDYRV